MPGDHKNWKEVITEVGISIVHDSNTKKTNDQQKASTERGPGEPTKEDNHIVDVVFVHGVCGDSRKTWSTRLNTAKTADENMDDHDSETNFDIGDGNDDILMTTTQRPGSATEEVFWPGDLLPRLFPRARIMTWGFDVKKHISPTSGSHASLLRHSETLLGDLCGVRATKSLRSRPIIFISHSLGGVLVKDALVMSQAHPSHYSDILDSTKGLIFFGTPHRGCKVASRGKMLASVMGNPLTKILGFIGQNSEHIDRLNTAFTGLMGSRSIHLHSFQEELPWKGVMIVPEDSSSTGLVHETRSLLHADHRGMVKMTSIKDVKFQRLTAVLVRWLGEVVQKESRDAKTTLAGGILTSEYKDFLRSLHVPESYDRFKGVEAAFQGTYTWLFQDGVGFKDFLSGKENSNIFWIQGKPASGKSTAMKFAIRHKDTASCLERFDQSPWVMVGHFFHDRGSAIQKSLQGFLLGLCFRILECRPDIFPYVYPTYIEKGHEGFDDRLDRADQRALSSWTVHALMDLLSVVRDRVDCSLNICAFVDALDEHDGSHTSLISALERLESLSSNPFVKLRLCMASRPENLFRTKFKDYPGLVIHEHTSVDIRHYAETRIHENTQGLLSEYGAAAIQRLVHVIIEKAAGVFLWLKMVIDEVVEGIQAGDTASEMEDLLSTIPSELSDLYARTIRRPRRRSGSLSSKRRNHELERYMLFQLALTSDPPLNLMDILLASSYLASGVATNDISHHSRQLLEYRLHTLSCGLLEVPSATEIVQFLHQTTKTFFQRGDGQAIICEGVDAAQRQPGDVLMLRTAAFSLEHWQHITLVHLIPNGQRAEWKHGAVVCDFLKPALRRLSSQDQYDALLRIVEYQHPSNRASLYLDHRHSFWEQSVVFYSLFGLHKSLENTLNGRSRPKSSHVKRGQPRDQFKCRLVDAAFLAYHELRQSDDISRRSSESHDDLRAAMLRTLRVLLSAFFGGRAGDITKEEAATWCPLIYNFIQDEPDDPLVSVIQEKLGW